LKKEFDVDEWLLEYEVEEEKSDPKYSIYFTPEYDGDEYEEH